MCSGIPCLPSIPWHFQSAPHNVPNRRKATLNAPRTRLNLPPTAQNGALHLVLEHCRCGELATFLRHRAATGRLFSEDEVMFM